MLSIRKGITFLSSLSICRAKTHTITASMSSTPHTQSYNKTSKIVTLEPVTATAVVILSHGLGDSALGWADGAQYMSQYLPHVRFILPTAKESPVTLNGGMKMNSWYDIVSLDKGGDEPCTGLDDSKSFLLSLVNEQVEKHKIPMNRICLVGFSQGAALSLYTSLTLDQPVGAVAAMSGYIPRKNGKMPDVNIENAKKIPFKLFHGTADNVVQYQFGQLSYNHLKETLGLTNVEFKSIPGLGHSVDMTELQDLAQFINKHVPNN